MEHQLASRRNVVGGIAAGIAIAGSVAFLGRRGGEPDAGGGAIRVVPGGEEPAFRPISHEVERWAANVGQPVRIGSGAGGAQGTIASVTPLPSGNRPADVRRAPFLVRFAMDTQTVPAGDRIYSVSTPVAGLTEIFLVGGAEVSGKTMLTAVFG